MIIPRASWAQTFKVILRLCNVIGFKKTVLIAVTFLAKLVTVLVRCHFQGVDDAIVRIKVLGHQVCVSLRDKGLSQELLTYGVHEPILSVILLNEIRRGDVIIEVGANIGYYALMECASIKGNGKVIAIEPNPWSQKLLKMNVIRNGYSKNIEFFPFGIGSERKTARMLMSNAFNLSSVISPWSGKAGEGEEQLIKMVTLDDLVKNESKIDIIRMDIEGYEYVALDGMIGTLTKFKPRIIFIELHPIPNYRLMESFFEKLIKLEYEIKWAVPRRLVEGMLEVPEDLLRKTCELIQKPSATHTNVSIRNVEETLGITEFAEKFLSSKKVYHVILTPRSGSSVCASSTLIVK